MSLSLKAIPLCQLQRSKINVRRTDKAADIEQLAASIEAHGLLENLVVAPMSSGDERFEVVAGGRRHAALKLLAKRKSIAADFPVPCLVRTANGASLTELSLAENFERAPLHPADQFEAFAKLHADGLPADDIALRFGLTPALVAQRLKLAAVSPRLIAEYRTGEMTLEQLMAFAINDDREAQEAFWFDHPYGDRSPYAIRRALTKAHVEGRDRRARFVGVKKYEEAGGIVLRDLFDAEDEGYFTDSLLLDRLAAEKLEVQAVSIRAEGWRWVEVTLDPETARTVRYTRVGTVEIALGKKEEKRLARLSERYDTLVTELEENGGGSCEELDQVSEELASLQAKKDVWPETEKARAGVLISLDWNGAVLIDRGLVRPEDQVPEADCKSARGKSPKEPGAYPESLLLDLSAHRTAALREMLASSPEQALTALLVSLASTVVLDSSERGCIGIGVCTPELERASKRIGESIAQQAFRTRQEQWQTRLADTDRLWECIASLDGLDRLSLLAHCVSATVTALWQRADADGRQADADRLALRLGLDMADWWRPTAANFFAALTKGQIVGVVSEAGSLIEGRRLAELKKDEMAERAERVLKETRWLPDPLRQSSANPEIPSIA